MALSAALALGGFDAVALDLWAGLGSLHHPIGQPTVIQPKVERKLPVDSHGNLWMHSGSHRDLAKHYRNPHGRPDRTSRREEMTKGWQEQVLAAAMAANRGMISSERMTLRLANPAEEARLVPLAGSGKRSGRDAMEALGGNEKEPSGRNHHRRVPALHATKPHRDHHRPAAADRPRTIATVVLSDRDRRPNARIPPAPGHEPVIPRQLQLAEAPAADQGA